MNKSQACCSGNTHFPLPHSISIPYIISIAPALVHTTCCVFGSDNRNVILKTGQFWSTFGQLLLL